MERTSAYQWHVTHGGRMVDFAGWEMPIQYTTITEEHHAVRKQAGLFDISHMGRLQIRGADGCSFLSRILTARVDSLRVGQVRYSLVCNERGGVLDDVLIYRLAHSYLLVVNAANRAKVVNWIDRHLADDRVGAENVQVEDETGQTFMTALQGPRSLEILQPLVETDLSALAYYNAVEAPVAGITSTISRTGYTGEDGFELIIPAADGLRLWERLLSAGESAGLRPCGLGCRDTLRLEAGMPLYGHEMDEETDPFAVGLGFAVKQDAGDFIGRQALLEKRRQGPGRKRVGLSLEGRRIAREGAEVFRLDQVAGRVTSGTYSPTLEASIAMAAVASEFGEAGTPLEVDIRGQRVGAKVVPLPFYRRAVDQRPSKR